MQKYSHKLKLSHSEPSRVILHLQFEDWSLSAIQKWEGSPQGNYHMFCKDHVKYSDTSAQSLNPGHIKGLEKFYTLCSKSMGVVSHLCTSSLEAMIAVFLLSVFV